MYTEIENNSRFLILWELEGIFLLLGNDDIIMKCGS